MGAPDPYQEYLARFQSLVGTVAVGAYGKFRGKLVKKLAPHELKAKHDELTGLSAHYDKAVARGDTINDALLKVIDQLKAELLLED